MRINADFSRRVVVSPAEQHWVASPQQGVERVLLDRIGGEQARATSLVRYAPGSHFPAHAHPGGEEILVLTGTFTEDGRHYPAGSYLRSPPGSSHQPSSEPGALIFVKLRQMRPDATARVRIDTSDMAAWTEVGARQVCPLYEDAFEQVQLHRLSAHEPLFGEALVRPGRQVELFLIDGVLDIDGQMFPRGTWARLPAADPCPLHAGATGAMLYIKIGTADSPEDGVEA